MITTQILLGIVVMAVISFIAYKLFTNTVYGKRC